MTRLPHRFGLLWAATALGAATMINGAVFVLFAKNKLGLGPVGYGLLLVPPAIGGVAGVLLGGVIAHSLSLRAAFATGGLATLAIAAAVPLVLRGANGPSATDRAA